jgi:recombination protein RecA
MSPKPKPGESIANLNPGRTCSLLKRGLKQLAPLVETTGTTVVFTNQLKIFGGRSYTIGGKVWEHADLKIELTLGFDPLNFVEGGPFITKVRLVKNTMAPPFKKAKISLIEAGFDQMVELLILGQQYGLIYITGNGGFVHQEAQIGKGVEIAKAWLRNRPEVAKTLREEILSKALDQTNWGESREQRI